MSDFGNILGSYKDKSIIIGIAIGIIGCALVALAYPMYDSFSKKGRAKIASEIIRLTDELMK